MSNKLFSAVNNDLDLAGENVARISREAKEEAERYAREHAKALASYGFICFLRDLSLKKFGIYRVYVTDALYDPHHAKQMQSLTTIMAFVNHTKDDVKLEVDLSETTKAELKDRVQIHNGTVVVDLSNIIMRNGATTYNVRGIHVRINGIEEELHPNQYEIISDMNMDKIIAYYKIPAKDYTTVREINGFCARIRMECCLVAIKSGVSESNK